MAILAVLFGLVVGALNPASVSIDLLWLQIDLPLGQAILLGFSIGLIVGVIFMYVFQVLPARHRLRRARSQLTRSNLVSGEANPVKAAADD